MALDAMLYRHRTALYAILLTILAAFVSFYRLGAGSMLGDEAAFASTTVIMRDTGDWIVPYIGEMVHLNAGPLYDWLTLLIAPFFQESPLWFRVPSATFAVGSVLLTFAIGLTLFGPEVGLLAGVLLTLNRDFQFSHGMRFGAADAITTFTVSAAILIHARMLRSGRDSLAGWGAIGVSLGFTCLGKPPVFGGFFFTMIVLHHAFTKRHRPIVEWLRGPFVAAMALAAVTAPWYLAIWHRLGGRALYELFVYNSVGRAGDGPVRDLLICVKGLSHSSIAFKLTIIAFLLAAAAWVVRDRRPQWRMLIFIAGAFLASLSAANKSHNYIYYAFPLVSILIAGMFLESGPRVAEWLIPGSRVRRYTVTVGAILACAVVAADSHRIIRGLFFSRDFVHAPIRVYEELTPSIDAGLCRLVVFGHPTQSRNTEAGPTPVGYEANYYDPQMTKATWIETAHELRVLSEEGVPTVVLLPQGDAFTAMSAFLDTLSPRDRAIVGFEPGHRHPVASFHVRLSDLGSPYLSVAARK